MAKIILECINLIEKADKISDVPDIKRLKGHPTAYRYRKGKYRIGFYMEEEIIYFAAFDTLEKIYRRFPI